MFIVIVIIGDNLIINDFKYMKHIKIKKMFKKSL